MAAQLKTKFEVHEHAFVSGPRRGGKLVHSHEGGNFTPHEHPNTGPGCYTIDKHEWAQKTGLRGGGTKKFTAKPSGEQLPTIPRAPAIFDVFVMDSALHASRVDGKLHGEHECDGKEGCGAISAGTATAERMQLGFGLSARVHDLRSRRKVAL